MYNIYTVKFKANQNKQTLLNNFVSVTEDKYYNSLHRVKSDNLDLFNIIILIVIKKFVQLKNILFTGGN